MKQVKQRFKQAYNQVIKQLPYATITALGSMVFMLINYLILLQTTTWEVFWNSNVPLYNILQVILTVIVSVLGGAAIAMIVYIFENRIQANNSNFITEFVALLFSATATGCTVCGAILLPLLGIATSLTALPLGGLDIKLLSALLLVYSLYDLSGHVLGICKPHKEKIIQIKDGVLTLNINRNTITSLKPLALIFVFIVAVYTLPKLGRYYHVDFSRTPTFNNSLTTLSSTQNTTTAVGVQLNQQEILNQINPPEGYKINITLGDIGPKLIRYGVIDLEKFKQVYDRSGQPLTPEQLSILTQGSNQKIRITKENAYFLLNFFWAVGLANKNRILTEGDMTKYGEDQIGYYASTGGWTLAKGDAMQYYAKFDLIPLTAEQQALLERVASNIYRPCCNNPTSFPDCNHGMALLGVLELMAANGATEEEMYEAAKYFNAFWFPQSYYDIAAYFKLTQGKDYLEIDAKTLLSATYSSVSGWQRIRNQVKQMMGEATPQIQGAGCGV